MKKEDIIIECKKFTDLYKKGLRVEKKKINVNAQDLLEFNPVLYDYLIDNSEDLTNILTSCFETIGLKGKVCFISLNNKISISEIRVNQLDKLYSIEGVVKRLTKVIPRSVAIKYECLTCNCIHTVLQTSKKPIPPIYCSCSPGKHVRFKQVGEVRKDIQELNLEEITDDLNGRQPQQLRIYLEDELTDSNFCNILQPGKRIEIIGVIRTLPPFMSSKDEESNLSEFMLIANNIVPLEKEDDLIITEEDIKEMQRIASDNPLQKLSESLAPEVYGNDLIKKAITLQLVKGVPRPKSDGSLSREDIHILLCGDVGCAKSVLLKSTITRTPKSKMVVGTKTSKVGLSAMAVKDELSGSWALEVGSLALCNNSLLGIDEIEKLPKEHLSELLEPMSMGTISVNKAGISATLPARTSILAASNPIYGNFDISQPLAKQIDLSTPVLNRFDAIFIILDKQTVEYDKNSISYLFQSYQEIRKSEIPISLFKKYISYCRKLKPKLNPEIKTYLEEFYLALRQQSKSSSVKGLPINLRNMEGVIKFAEAHAKIRLSPTVELEDLDVAKKILLFCLRQIGYDAETGVLDYSRATQKFPYSKRSKLETIFGIINELTKQIGKEIPYVEILKKCDDLGIKKNDMDISLDQLKMETKLFEPKSGIYSLV